MQERWPKTPFGIWTTWLHVSGRALYMLTSIDSWISVFETHELAESYLLILTFVKGSCLRSQVLVQTGMIELQHNIYVSFLVFMKNP